MSTIRFMAAHTSHEHRPRPSYMHAKTQFYFISKNVCACIRLCECAFVHVCVLLALHTLIIAMIPNQCDFFNSTDRRLQQHQDLSHLPPLGVLWQTFHSNFSRNKYNQLFIVDTLILFPMLLMKPLTRFT